jgi:hypothetical protein
VVESDTDNVVVPGSSPGVSIGSVPEWETGRIANPIFLGSIPNGALRVGRLMAWPQISNLETQVRFLSGAFWGRSSVVAADVS